MADDDNASFLSRWSRRKAQARAVDGAPPAAAAASAVEPDATTPATAEAAPASTSNHPADVPDSADVRAALESADAAPASTPPPPTLDDVERLTPDADFSPFVDRLVQPEVRNAAMKKLFTDPHFNVMDGLDVYIDDYNKTEPMPRQWLRQLVQARVLGLLDDEVEEQPRPGMHAALSPSRDEGAAADEARAAGEVQSVEEAQAADVDEADKATSSTTEPDNPGPDEDVDLPLQPDDAAGHEGARAAADDGADNPGR